jgi:ubiquitin-conjugating enzyme E2 D/E
VSLLELCPEILLKIEISIENEGSRKYSEIYLGFGTPTARIHSKISSETRYHHSKSYRLRMCIGRIQKEFRDLSSAPPVNCFATPDSHDLFHWTGTISGPQQTPYESGTFSIDISLPRDYPFDPPSIIFKTKIYHPNVSSKGMICLGILIDKWIPAFTIANALTSILELLEKPNIEDPLLPGLANQLKTDPEKFWKTAREWTQKYAK